MKKEGGFGKKFPVEPLLFFDPGSFSRILLENFKNEGKFKKFRQFRKVQEAV